MSGLRQVIILLRDGMKFVATIPEGYSWAHFSLQRDLWIAAAPGKEPLVLNEDTKEWMTLDAFSSRHTHR